MPALKTSPEGLQAFDTMLLGALVLLRPPEKLNVAEWADKYAYLSPEDSARPGKFYTSNTPYMREIMETLSDPHFQSTIGLMASQLGKTQLGKNFVGYIAHHDPGPTLLLEPDENLAKAFAQDRIVPMVRDTPVLKPLFATSGDRMHRMFPGGHLTIGWASAPSQMASRPIRYLIEDEAGAYDAAPNQEGNPRVLARQRMATFDNRHELVISTPRLKRTCIATAAFNDSDQRYYYVPCPHCGHKQTLRWEQLVYKRASDDPENYQLTDVSYTCESCTQAIVEDHKFAMVRDGEWRAHKPGGGDGKTAGFHLNALYSTIGYGWSDLIIDFLKCKTPKDVQAFTNTKLALPWDEQAEGVEQSALQKRAEDYKGEAPAGVVAITCGADVQPDRIEATKWGWGVNDESWVIQHGIFHGATDVAGKGAWAEFDLWRRQRVEHELGLDLPVACTFIDSGDGNRTDQVYSYCKAHEREKVYACKGSSQAAAPVVNEAKRTGRYKTLLVMVGTSTVKDTLFARMRLADRTKPGYIHFPKHGESGCGAEYYLHLTAEALVTTTSRSGQRSQWTKLRARNESLDCAVYAYAAKQFMRQNFHNLAKRLQLAAARIDPAAVEERRRIWLLKLALDDHAGFNVAATINQALSGSRDYSHASRSPKPEQKPRISARTRAMQRLRARNRWIHG